MLYQLIAFISHYITDKYMTDDGFNDPKGHLYLIQEREAWFGFQSDPKPQEFYGLAGFSVHIATLVRKHPDFSKAYLDEDEQTIIDICMTTVDDYLSSI